MKTTPQHRNWISRVCLTAASAALALAAVLVLAVITTQPAQAQDFTTLFSFNFTDGSEGVATLVQGANGNLYGTTYYGGANNPTNCNEDAGCGTVFKITPSGALTSIYSFCAQLQNGQCPDGNYPLDGLVLATDGNFYGTTSNGGVNGHGTVFQITPGGSLTSPNYIQLDTATTMTIMLRISRYLK